MSDLRQEIRAILREELSSVLAEMRGVEVETIRISTSADLNAFAQNLVTRMQTTSFATKLKKGEIQFELEQPAAPLRQVPAVPMVTASSNDPEPPTLHKNLITEADLESFGSGVLRLPADARMTPLAQDESRRRGIRIERIKA